jgi:hypothetical protein
LDGALSAGTSDRLNDDAEMPDETEMRSRGAPGGASRRYAITVREREIFRYTLPDFFPDFNETPLEARRNAGLDDDLSSSRESVTKKTKQPYVWRRGVLAGTERSDPLDVIARERERFERELAKADDDDDDDDDEAVRVVLVSSSSGAPRDPAAAEARGRVERRGGRARNRLEGARGFDSFFLPRRALRDDEPRVPGGLATRADPVGGRRARHSDTRPRAGEHTGHEGGRDVAGKNSGNDRRGGRFRVEAV